MSDTSASNAAGASNHATHIVSTKVYLAVFLTLMAMTAVTVWVAFLDLGAMNTFVALGIAGFKTCLVGLFFMHLKWSHRLNAIAAVAGIACLFLLISLTVGDTMSRHWLDRSQAFGAHAGEAPARHDTASPAPARH